MLSLQWILELRVRFLISLHFFVNLVVISDNTDCTSKRSVYFDRPKWKQAHYCSGVPTLLRSSVILGYILNHENSFPLTKFDYFRDVVPNSEDIRYHEYFSLAGMRSLTLGVIAFSTSSYDGPSELISMSTGTGIKPLNRTIYTMFGILIEVISTSEPRGRFKFLRKLSQIERTDSPTNTRSREGSLVNICSSWGMIVTHRSSSLNGVILIRF